MNRHWLAAGMALAMMGPGVESAEAQTSPAAIVTDDPQTATFTGSNSLSFPSDDSLELTDVSTIEFWVKPNWRNLEYNPVILAALGATGPRYSIVMTADKKAIGLMSGNEWDYVEFDFSDGKSHHVAFVNQGELTDVYIDGELADSISQPIADIPALTLHIGSADGFSSPFVGQLGEIRLWDTAVDGDDIESYMRVHVLSSTGTDHPDFDDLVGVSDFASGRRGFTLLDNSSTFAELNDDLAFALGLDTATPAKQEPIKLADGTVVEPLSAEEQTLFDAPVSAEGANQAKGGSTQAVGEAK